MHEKYNIGKVEKICGITKKTLRFYDKIGLLSPSEIAENNGYRYYNKASLYLIAIIKSYKQSGFKLEDIKKLIYKENFNDIENNFRDKICELKNEEKKILQKIVTLEEWYSLIREARIILNNNLTDITIKFYKEQEMIYQEQDFDYDYMSSVVNIEFMNYIEKLEEKVTGAIVLEFSSFFEKMNGKSKKVKILQKSLLTGFNNETKVFFGGAYISCYHIGAYSDIDKTYSKLRKWIEIRGYKIEEGCYERYVLDYWVTKDEQRFVTEILIKISENIEH